MNKKISITIISIMISLVMILSNISYAGQVYRNQNAYYYMKDNGQMAKNEWIELDMDNDGLLEYYHYNEQGILDANCITSDGYLVNEKGQWVKFGIVQHKNVNDNKFEPVCMPSYYKEVPMIYEYGKKVKYTSPLPSPQIVRPCSKKGMSRYEYNCCDYVCGRYYCDRDIDVYISNIDRIYHIDKYCCYMNGRRLVRVEDAIDCGYIRCMRCFERRCR